MRCDTLGDSGTSRRPRLAPAAPLSGRRRAAAGRGGRRGGVWGRAKAGRAQSRLAQAGRRRRRGHRGPTRIWVGQNGPSPSPLIIAPLGDTWLSSASQALLVLYSQLLRRKDRRAGSFCCRLRWHMHMRCVAPAPAVASPDRATLDSLPGTWVGGWEPASFCARRASATRAPTAAVSL